MSSQTILNFYNQNRTPIAIGVLVFLVLLIINASFNSIHEQIAQAKEDKHELLVKAMQFNTLNSRWSDTAIKDTIIKRVSNIKTPTSINSRGTKTTLSFEKLDAHTADKLAHTLLNSDVKIERFEMRVKENLIDMFVEVVK